MGTFYCRCGFLLDSMIAGDENKAILVDQENFFKWCSEIASSLRSFGVAIAEGRRESWLVENYYHGRPTFEIDDGDVIFDLIFFGIKHGGLEGYRCPECSRITLEEKATKNGLRTYAPEGDA